MNISLSSGHVCFQPEYRSVVGLSGKKIAIKCINYNEIPLIQQLLFLRQSPPADLLVLIHVDFLVARQIVMQSDIKTILYSMLNLRLVISEDFPNLNEGRNNPLIKELRKGFHLWFWGLGNTRTSMIPVMEGLFEGVIFDSNFYSEYKDSLILKTTVDILKQYTKYIIADENNTLYQIE